MRLPDELIESLLWSLGSARSGDAQRGAPRVATRCVAMLTPVEGGAMRESESREVLLRDISATGASVLVGSKPGWRRFVLDIAGLTTGPLLIFCTTKHCDRSPTGGYVIGAEFVRFISKPAAPDSRDE